MESSSPIIQNNDTFFDFDKVKINSDWKFTPNTNPYWSSILKLQTNTNIIQLSSSNYHIKFQRNQISILICKLQFRVIPILNSILMLETLMSITMNGFQLWFQNSIIQYLTLNESFELRIWFHPRIELRTIELQTIANARRLTVDSHS